MLPPEYSHLYLAVGGVLAGVICIFDPLRDEAAGVLQELHDLGISKICMMTGDSFRTAQAVARKLSIDEFHAEVLPEDKAEFIRSEDAAGRRVIMVADIAIQGGGLKQLIFLRRLSMAMMSRIRTHYRFIMIFNGSLIAAGAVGLMAPATSSLLHNTSTIVIGLHSMTGLNVTETEKSSTGKPL